MPPAPRPQSCKHLSCGRITILDIYTVLVGVLLPLAATGTTLLMIRFLTLAWPRPGRSDDEEAVGLEYSLSEVMDEVGPFVAVGRPGDKLPPLGVARSWQRAC